MKYKDWYTTIFIHCWNGYGPEPRKYPDAPPVMFHVYLCASQKAVDERKRSTCGINTPNFTHRLSFLWREWFIFGYVSA